MLILLLLVLVALSSCARDTSPSNADTSLTPRDSAGAADVAPGPTIEDTSVDGVGEGGGDVANVLTDGGGDAPLPDAVGDLPELMEDLGSGDLGSEDLVDAGDTGASGDAGDTGTSGDAGDTGTSGDTGASGDAGDTGTSGDAGAPELALVRCDELGDEVLTEAVYESAEVVPEGYFADGPELQRLRRWYEPCSESLEVTSRRALEAFPNDVLTGEGRETEYFYEVEVEAENTLRLYRNTRCDYFDGVALQEFPHQSWEPLAKLVGYLWYTGYYNLSGSHLLGSSGERISDLAMYRVESCYVLTVYGDFGLCDEITLWKRTAQEDSRGVVSFGEDERLRSISGRCN